MADPQPVAPHGVAALAGAQPPAPAWFSECLAQHPERTFVNVDGADIETLSWGERGAPGLLLLHGQSACADWWSFIPKECATTTGHMGVSI